MTKPLTPARRELLRRLEFILGREFYNGNIRNYGPGGFRLPDGRSFRYPLVMRRSDGEKQKVTGIAPADLPDEMLRSGYYAVGANHFDVIAGLEKVLEYLEEHAGLVIEPSPGNDDDR